VQLKEVTNQLMIQDVYLHTYIALYVSV